MSTFTNLISETLEAYKGLRLGDAFNALTDASIALELEIEKQLENTEKATKEKKGT